MKPPLCPQSEPGGHRPGRGTYGRCSRHARAQSVPITQSGCTAATAADRAEIPDGRTLPGDRAGRRASPEPGPGPFSPGSAPPGLGPFPGAVPPLPELTATRCAVSAGAVRALPSLPPSPLPVPVGVGLAAAPGRISVLAETGTGTGALGRSDENFCRSCGGGGGGGSGGRDRRGGRDRGEKPLLAAPLLPLARRGAEGARPGAPSRCFDRHRQKLPGAASGRACHPLRSRFCLLRSVPSRC